MNFDYSPAELAPRRSAKRSVVMVTLSVAMLAAVVGHESIATRRTTLADAANAEMAAAFPATAADIALDAQLQAQATTATPPSPAPTDWKALTVESGQTLSTIFEAEGLPHSESLKLLTLSKDASQLRNLRPGETIRLRKNTEQELEELSYELDETHTLQVRRVDDQLEAFTIAAELEKRQAEIAGVIDSSLFAAAQKAGLSNRLTLELAQIFNYDIDFALDLRRGDRFVVIYDAYYKDGKKLRDGNITVAEFVNKGKTHQAMRYVDKKGNVAYYAPDGRSFRKAFIRTPVDFARISSGFNMARRHPILNIIRAHKGVDYAAGTGTPVKTTGDGVVEFLGTKSGYGNAIVIRHDSKYETLYGHLSRFRSGLRNGSKVKMGQVIGYVGATGLATAPHLHYEFRVNGLHVNPITVALPRANPLSRSEVAAWRSNNAGALAALESISMQQSAMAEDFSRHGNTATP
ncbi:OapA family protein [Solimonas sp. K1W22B-7]|uniref:OapA family protein n=1 Tax=Solimonas sp. K1W22B-7 TaxID=2303331 RepID=UPI001F099164|nr:peptidoglycan DD-metalloendopeptidase family protein [Solimonas sp. K1W22B-7]